MKTPFSIGKMIEPSTEGRSKFDLYCTIITVCWYLHGRYVRFRCRNNSTLRMRWAYVRAHTCACECVNGHRKKKSIRHTPRPQEIVKVKCVSFEWTKLEKRLDRRRYNVCDIYVLSEIYENRYPSIDDRSLYYERSPFHLVVHTPLRVLKSLAQRTSIRYTCSKGLFHFSPTHASNSKRIYIVILYYNIRSGFVHEHNRRYAFFMSCTRRDQFYHIIIMNYIRFVIDISSVGKPIFFFSSFSFSFEALNVCTNQNILFNDIPRV